ncbi:MAG: glutathione peroxidase [Bacteroidia bacterium]|nr:glutathione peroxidase [Bacteroidia bacterium]
MLQLLLALLLLVPQANSIHAFKVKDADGKTIDFSAFKGKKILIVNTASECGYTPQYEALQELYIKYRHKLVVIAFPANNFGGQEPGTNAEIKAFCSKNYQVTFPVASKISVKGDDMAPLFKWLTSQSNPDFAGDINWNFEKFLLDENGKLIHRYRSKVKPLDPVITNAL